MTERSEQIIQEVADSLRAWVAGVESGIATTRNHYGDYMGMMLKFADDAGQRRVLAKALIAAGANEQGVADALRVST